MGDDSLFKLEELNLEQQARKLRESDIERNVCEYAAKKYGMMVEKFTSPGKRSVPDRIFSAPGGRIFYIEFKAPGAKATAKQQKDHQRRRALGFAVFIVDDIVKGRDLIDRIAKKWGLK